MRILLVSPFQPHPTADHGGAIYLGWMVRELQRQAEVATVHFRHADDREPTPGVPAYTVPRQRNAELSAAALCRQRLRLGWEWGALGVPLEVAKHRTAPFRQLLRRAVTEFGPDAVLLEFSIMAWCLEELEGVTTVLTDHECGESTPRHFGPANLGRWRDRRLWRRYVRRFYPMADVCQTLTEVDATILAAATRRPVAVRSPLVHPPDGTVEPANAGPVMVFFGDYRHHPNPEAAHVLATDVLPLVRRELPEAELWFAGARADGHVADLGRLPGVRVTGFVEDLASLLGQARCMVAPVFSGSGVRSKSLLAMAHGLPLVTNRLGLQGMAPPAAAIALGETADELAAASLTFLTDADAATRAGHAAERYVRETFSEARLVEEQLARIRAVEHRP